MKCVNHPDRDATAQCCKCLKLLCNECRILSKDGTKAICRPCLAILKNPPVSEQPPQSMIETVAVKPEIVRENVLEASPLKPDVPHNLETNNQNKAKNKSKKRNIIIGVCVGLVLLAAAASQGTADTADDESEQTDQAFDPPYTQSSDTQNDTEITTSQSEDDLLLTYIAECGTYEYENLQRNPNAYKGNKAKFTGRIVQVMEGWFGATDFRIDIGNENIVYVSYTMKDDELRYLEDDNVTVYGELTGVKSYTALLGNQITIPSIEAKYIDRGTIGESNSDTQSSSSIPNSIVVIEGAEVAEYPENMYIVGVDLPAGEYIAVAMSKYSGSITVYPDSKKDDILYIENFNTTDYITLENGQYVDLKRASLYNSQACAAAVSDFKSIAEGAYLVGRDIPAGEYKAIAASEYGGSYTVYNSSSVNRKIEDIENFKATSYFTVSDGQYLIIKRCTVEWLN